MSDKKVPYKDPLHFSYEDLTIRYKDQSMILNKRFLDANPTAWGNLDLIKNLFKRKFRIFHVMDQVDDIAFLRRMDALLVKLEFRIQEAFGFERDAKFHRFWERPKCECPVMDNKERWGTKTSVRTGNCPLHGKENE